MNRDCAPVRRMFGCCLWLVVPLIAGCSGEYREDISDNDPPAVVALKEAGADVRQVPIAGANGLARTIDLVGLTFTPELMEHVLAVESVVELKVTGEEFTDSHLEKVAGLKNLALLDASGTAVTDEGLSHLTGMRSLSTLNLNDTQITGTGLARLPHVASLSLSNVAIGDADLEQLNHMKRLNFINLSGTQVSADAARALRKKRGNLMVMGIKLR